MTIIRIAVAPSDTPSAGVYAIETNNRTFRDSYWKAGISTRDAIMRLDHHIRKLFAEIQALKFRFSRNLGEHFHKSPWV